VVLIALAVIAIAWGIGARMFVAKKAAGPEAPLASVSFAYYTNAKGQRWAIPTGESQFTVASQETYPRFVLATIDPTKVSIGDTQKMQIVVRDNVPLVKVWAEVEHDHGTDTIPLTLGASSTVSYNTIKNQKYLVGNDGKLVINNGQNKTGAIAELIQSLFQKAQAEQAVDYSYSGSWVVHDTATITYHTTFYATDTQDRKVKLVIAWSDPCSVSGGVLQGNCSFSNGTDGTDATSTNFSGYTLTLTSSTWVVNPGYSFILSGGTLNIGASSALMMNEYLYYPDSDGDGYAATSTKSAFTASSTSGYVRVSQAVGTTNPTIDCNDNDKRANQGDGAWWASAGNAASGWTAGDFNCSGVTGVSWDFYNASYQTSGYPGIYNGSAYISTDELGTQQRLISIVCFWNNGTPGSGPSTLISTSQASCGSIYGSYIGSFYIGSYYQASVLSCGTSAVWYGSAVEVCK